MCSIDASTHGLETGKNPSVASMHLGKDANSAEGSSSPALLFRFRAAKRSPMVLYSANPHTSGCRHEAVDPRNTWSPCLKYRRILLVSLLSPPIPIRLPSMKTTMRVSCVYVRGSFSRAVHQ